MNQPTTSNAVCPIRMLRTAYVTYMASPTARNYSALLDALQRACDAQPEQPANAGTVDTPEAKVHAKVECFEFNTEDVRLVLTDRDKTQELRMHNDDAWFIVEAIAAANRTRPAPAAPSEEAVELLTRFDMETKDAMGGWLSDTSMAENKEGDWVRYEDVRAAQKGQSK